MGEFSWCLGMQIVIRTRKVIRQRLPRLSQKAFWRIGVQFQSFTLILCVVVEVGYTCMYIYRCSQRYHTSSNITIWCQNRGARERPILVGERPSVGSEKTRDPKRLHKSPYRDRRERNSDRIPRTCEWFLAHKLFRDWQERKSSRML